ncbi:5'-nucleotidase [Lachnoclostridium phytofermentans]|uniref:5'-nucleotidase n=1 Tax=Lachnoclostridium phytofermentans (strain ATCC 700394 / DSM 18823 / ISDg) TaxID=357809 RepID=A9KHR4_LACP7|nr:5'-nucleotidase [Lachnoclostridium phytofermentans]ABX42349.1 5'-nucleotidase [Lachnoclostridium phytofermentans ISDg]
MPLKLEDKLVVGISSRALFDLEEENTIFERDGLRAYSDYQILHENDILKPGTAFPLVKALQNLNTDERHLTEIIIMSKNSADTSLRIFNSIEHYGLKISRAALVGGVKISPYLNAFRTDLFLSANEDDVQEAINANIAAGIICSHGELPIEPNQEIDQIRIAFDGDAVIFSDESEQLFQSKGLKAFAEHEHINAQEPLPEGPFAKLLKTLSFVQQQFPKETVPIRTALVTARNAPAHERVIRTLRAWNVRIDEAFFLGGIEKSEVLKAFGANIFFDDQTVHTDPASKLVPAARVPYKQ